MYIAIGTPRVLSTRVSAELGGGFQHINEAVNAENDHAKGSILMVRKAPQREIFATITPTTLCLWSIKVSESDAA
jgi:hypothetical protein